MPYSSERALILASVGRDAALAASILAEAKIEALPCKNVPDLVTELRKGAGFAVVAEEAFRGADLLNLTAFLKRQPEWSDFQFILLTFRGGGLERNPAAARLLDVLGNVTFLERPFHPTTLVSLAQAALRGRRRQYVARNAEAALRQSEERRRMASDAAQIGIWDYDLTTNELSWDERTRAVFGLSPDALVSYDVFLAGLHPDDRDATHAANQQALKTTGKGDYDIEYRTVGLEDGITRWIHAKGKTYFENGQAVRFIGTVVDITTRKMTEERLARSEAELRQAQRVGGFGSYLWDLESNTASYSPEYLNLHGLPSSVTAESFESWLSRVHPDDREYAARRAREVFYPDPSPAYEYRIVRPSDGQTCWIAERREVLYDAERKPVRAVGAQQDITQQRLAEEALRLSEERYRGIFQHAGTGIAITNLKGQFQSCNPAYATMLGYTEEELRSLIFADLVHPEDRETNMVDIRRLLAEEIPSFEILNRYVRKNGATLLVHKHVSLLRDAAGHPSHIIGLVTDLTEHKQNEERLRRNAETFAALVEQSPLGIYTVDSQFRIRNMSAGAMPAFRNVQPLIGRDFGEAMRILWPEPFASEAIRIFRHTLETGEPYVSQGLTEKRNDIGTSESYEWQVNRVTLADGQHGVVCYFFDTTRLQQAYQAVRKSEERLRFSLHAASAGAWEWDILSGKSTWSPENYALFDLEPGADNPSYADWEARIHPEDREAANQQVRDVLEGREAEFRAEHRIVRRDGSVRWLAGFGKVERDADGVALRMSGINIDITERKRDEEHIQLLMREVNHRSKNLLSLVQGIAHLTASTGAQDFIQRFGARIQSLSAAQDLLIRSEWKAVPLEDLVCSQLSHFADLIGARIAITGPALSITPAASQAIGMALHELATNAAKYGSLSNGSGRVDIAWNVSASGVAEPVLTMSWVEQGGPPVAKPQRRGFGSTVTSKMVEASVGGEVSVDYARAGLVWRFSCPAGNIVEGRLPSTVNEAPWACSGGGRVLVVEDEPLIAAEIAITLELAGFKIIGPTGSVSHALALMEGDGCDAAVLDVNLGHETSEPIARGLMSDGKPFVVVSGYSRAQLPQVLRAAPLIGKPLSPAMLEAEVKRLVATAAPRRLHS